MTDPQLHGSLAAARELLFSFEGAEQLPAERFMKYLEDWDVNTELVVAVISIYNPELIRSRMSELEQLGWGDIQPDQLPRMRGVNRTFAKYWGQIDLVERLIILLERDANDPLVLGNYSVRGPAQWLIEDIWRATGVTPVNPVNSEDAAFMAAWEADHPNGPRCHPEIPEPPFQWDTIPIDRFDISDMASRRNIFKAQFWPVSKKARNVVLPACVGLAALWVALHALQIVKTEPFFAIPIYALLAIAVLIFAYIMLASHILSAYEQQVRISQRGNAIIGIKIVRDSTPHLEIHTHFATPVGSGAGRQFREELTPYVKRFVTEIEPGMAIKIKCPNVLWVKVEAEVNQNFPAEQGWRVERTRTTTMIYPPHVAAEPQTP